jgi:hypothetical protein
MKLMHMDRPDKCTASLSRMMSAYFVMSQVNVDLAYYNVQ